MKSSDGVDDILTDADVREILTDAGDFVDDAAANGGDNGIALKQLADGYSASSDGEPAVDNSNLRYRAASLLTVFAIGLFSGACVTVSSPEGGADDDSKKAPDPTPQKEPPKAPDFNLERAMIGTLFGHEAYHQHDTNVAELVKTGTLTDKFKTDTSELFKQALSAGYSAAFASFQGLSDLLRKNKVEAKDYLATLAETIDAKFVKEVTDLTSAALLDRAVLTAKVLEYATASGRMARAEAVNGDILVDLLSEGDFGRLLISIDKKSAQRVTERTMVMQSEPMIQNMVGKGAKSYVIASTDTEYVGSRFVSDGGRRLELTKENIGLFTKYDNTLKAGDTVTVFRGFKEGETRQEKYGADAMYRKSATLIQKNNGAVVFVGGEDLLKLVGLTKEAVSLVEKRNYGFAATYYDKLDTIQAGLQAKVDGLVMEYARSDVGERTKLKVLFTGVVNGEPKQMGFSKENDSSLHMSFRDFYKHFIESTPSDAKGNYGARTALLLMSYMGDERYPGTDFRALDGLSTLRVIEMPVEDLRMAVDSGIVYSGKERALQLPVSLDAAKEVRAYLLPIEPQ